MIRNSNEKGNAAIHLIKGISQISVLLICWENFQAIQNMMGVSAGEHLNMDKMSKAGDSLGYTNVGWLYENGEVGEPDKDKALKFYKKAADAGDQAGRKEYQRLISSIV